MKPGDLRQFHEIDYARHSGCVFLVLEIHGSHGGKQVKFLMNGVIEESWLFSYVESNSRPLGPV